MDEPPPKATKFMVPPTLKGRHTALVNACKQGDFAHIKELVAIDPDICRYTLKELKSSLKVTPLMQALDHKRTDIMKFLVECGANVQERSGVTNQSAVMFAAKHGNIEALEYLLAHGDDVHHVDAAGNTALHIAVRYKRRDAALFLLKRGVDVDHRDRDGNTAFLLACRMSSTRMLGDLIKAGADIHALTNTGRNALHTAAYKATPRVMEYLVNKGINVKCTGISGDTPLHLAASALNLKAIKSLLSRGADPNAITETGTSVCVRLFEGIGASYTNAWHACLRMLVKHGANPNDTTHERSTVSIAAAVHLRGNFRACDMKVLLECGVDLNAVNLIGQCALSFIVLRYNSLRCVIDMLEHGAVAMPEACKPEFSPIRLAIISSNRAAFGSDGAYCRAEHVLALMLMGGAEIPSDIDLQTIIMNGRARRFPLRVIAKAIYQRRLVVLTHMAWCYEPGLIDLDSLKYLGSNLQL